MNVDKLYSALTYKPYTIEPIRSGWLGRTEFAICFDDTQIRTTNMDYDNLKSMVHLLNCAWQAGYGSGHVAGEIDQLDKSIADLQKIDKSL